MVATSKIFQPPLNRIHCGRFLHSLPGQSCTEAFFWNLYRNHVSSAKYYLPLLLFPLIFNGCRQTKRRVWSILTNYLQTASFASTINALAFYLACLMRRLNGRFVWLCTPFLPTYLAAQLSWWVPPRVQQLYVTGITHATIEGLLRQLDMPLVHSHAGQTLVFMLCSLVVLRRQQTQSYSGFWFIRPKRLPSDYSEWSLGERVKQSLLELRTYLGIGLVLDLMNAMLHGDLKKLQLKSTSFMLSYMGIYKLVQCVLAGRLDLKHTNILAAFFSGGAFGLLNGTPLTYMSLAVVIASQVLWQHLCTLDATHNELLAVLQRVPWAHLLIPPSLAYLVHNMLFHRHVVNGVAKSFIDATSDKNVTRLYTLIKQPIDTILTTVNKLPITPILF